jgi:FAD/FMN-containing dehydrogenase
VDTGTHPDLFWAIRGGGGNFGVATRFRFRLHDVDTIMGGMLILPATPEIVASFVAEADAAREELSTIATVMKAPPMPFLPAEAHGKLILMAKLVFAGDLEAGEHAIAPFRSLAEPIADMVKPMRYPEIYPPGDGNHPVASIRTMFLETIDRSVSKTIAEHLRGSTARMAAIEIRVLGGAMGRVRADATAFAHRSSRIMVNIAAMYADPNEAAVHNIWVDDFAGALRQGNGGAYVGFLSDEGGARVREAYPGPTWERLAAVKRRYDPSNLFRLNHNVPPSKIAFGDA